MPSVKSSLSFAVTWISALREFCAFASNSSSVLLHRASISFNGEVWFALLCAHLYNTGFSFIEITKRNSMQTSVELSNGFSFSTLVCVFPERICERCLFQKEKNDV